MWLTLVWAIKTFYKQQLEACYKCKPLTGAGNSKDWKTKSRTGPVLASQAQKDWKKPSQSYQLCSNDRQTDMVMARKDWLEVIEKVEYWIWIPPWSLQQTQWQANPSKVNSSGKKNIYGIYVGLASHILTLRTISLDLNLFTLSDWLLFSQSMTWVASSNSQRWLLKCIDLKLMGRVKCEFLNNHPRQLNQWLIHYSGIYIHMKFRNHMSRNVRKRTFWHVRPTKTQISLRVRAVWSESSLSTWRNFVSLAIQNAPMKILMRLCECAGWSESSLGADFRRYVYLRCGSDVLAVEMLKVCLLGCQHHKR